VFSRKALIACAAFSCFAPQAFLKADKRPASDNPRQATSANQQQRPDFAPSLYFVAFRDGVTPANDRAIEASRGRVEKCFEEIRAVSVRINNPNQLAALQRNPRVEYVEEVPMRYKMDLATAQLTPSMSNGLYGLITTRSTSVHPGITGSLVKVGVADTGLDYSHPDIATAYKGGTDAVSNDTNPWWNNDPEETHGTHVAATILGRWNNVGVYGVAYDADLYHARVLGPNGGTSADIMDGVRWLVEQAGCRIVNMSLGGRTASRTEESFYKLMRSKGALVVAATGNDGANRISYPAGYAVNLAVGAVDHRNVKADFSNSGKNIDLVAPGVLVLSAVPANMGSEASVKAAKGTEYRAFGLEFAGKGSVQRSIMYCGLGRAGEFPAGVSGQVALIQRGEISFADKVTNAMNAGALAVIIYNNAAGEFTGTLGAEGRWVPAVTVSDVVGAALRSSSSGTVLNQVSSYDHWDGTSMATPHVSGVAALVLSKKPSLTAAQLESILISNTQDLGARGYDTLYGNGLVDAVKAVNAAN
jgi:subtilisin family serine protease